jgi:hypothetical protein
LGSNEDGQTGAKRHQSRVEHPEKISELDSVDVAGIGCMGYNSFVITREGGLYLWGREFGESWETERTNPGILRNFWKVSK